MGAHCSDCDPGELTHSTPAYRRALLAVAFLNLGFAVIEIAGGFFARSQALKADALDFAGDGAITLLAVLALRRGPRWRARSALAQAVFLGLMGAGVLAATVYRTMDPVSPKAEAMELLGFLALAVNVAAAFILIPHRTGDANVRAVWLFSRNDAIGNAAVIAAGFAVAWTGTAWPDLLVAGAIAGLFLHSATNIFVSARTELT